MSKGQSLKQDTWSAADGRDADACHAAAGTVLAILSSMQRLAALRALGESNGVSYKTNLPSQCGKRLMQDLRRSQKDPPKGD